MNSGFWLEKAAAKWPDHTAIEDENNSYSYRQLLEQATARAQQLLAYETTTDQEDSDNYIVIKSQPSCEFVISLHACWLAGKIAVVLDPRISLQEEAERLEQLQYSPPAQADTAVVLFTSGTEGEPKAVELTFSNFQASAEASAERLGVEATDRWLCVVPVAHVAGLSIPIRSVIYGTTCVLRPQFDAEAVLKDLRNSAISAVSLVPTMLGRLLEAGLQSPPALRFALIGGAPVTGELIDRAAAAGVPLAVSYGLTEACSQVATSTPADVSRPYPLSGVEVKVASDGELLVAGPTVAKNMLAADGWLHTGDIGQVHASGHVELLGRKKELIISGGENVSPFEVEAVINRYPDVVESAVYGIESAEWGQQVVAAVVVAEGTTVDADGLLEHCRSLLLPFKVPKQIRFLNQLPKTPLGKLKRSELATFR